MQTHPGKRDMYYNVKFEPPESLLVVVQISGAAESHGRLEGKNIQW